MIVVLSICDSGDHTILLKPIRASQLLGEVMPMEA